VKSAATASRCDSGLRLHSGQYFWRLSAASEALYDCCEVLLAVFVLRSQLVNSLPPISCWRTGSSAKRVALARGMTSA